MRLRTGYSFRVAAGSLDECIDRIKECGWPAAPITDRASTFGWVRWEKIANAAGLRPVFGVELAVTNDLNAKKPATDFWLFLALDSVTPINKLVSLATQQFRYQPLLTYNDAMSARGVIRVCGHRADFSAFEPDEYTFYGLSPAAARGHVRRAIERGLRIVAVSDNVYPRPEDKEFYEILCGRNAAIQTYDQHIQTDHEWLESTARVFPDEGARRRALDLRSTLLEQCRAELQRAELAHPPRPKSLRDMCLDGAAKLKCDLSRPEYAERLDRELALIKEKNFEDYFYLVADICQWARKRIAVGPARGSSCGSLVCYLLEITTIDPIKHNLIFERFIDVNRMDLPDIDIDFSDQNRHLVFDRLREVYGAERVARLGTVALYKARSALQEAGAALRIPRREFDAVIDSMIYRSSGDSRVNDTLKDTLSTTIAGKALSEKWPEIMIATRLEGHPRHYSQHAAGVVVAAKPIVEYVAVDHRTNATMCDKQDAEKRLGLLKIDALGLTQLSVFEDALEMAGMTMEDLQKVPLDDQAAFDVLNRGEFAGIFQWNGRALQSLTQQIHVSKFEDIVAISALARPGPLVAGGALQWVKRRTGETEIPKQNPLLEEQTRDTYGVVIYQETVMNICRKIGNFSWADTATIRKLMSSSQGDEKFAKFETQFLKGAQENGLTLNEAKDIWEQINTFGSWAFNRCLEENTEIHPGVKIRDLYNADKLPTVMSLTPKGTIVMQRIKAVHKNGPRPVYRYTFDDGSEVSCTKDHRFIINDKWKPIKAAKIGDTFKKINGQTTLICEEFIGERETYDLEMPIYHNFTLSNGIVTHNSHAVAYGHISYWCCWMKAYYPFEFAAATLTHELDPQKQIQLLREMVAEGYSYVPVDPKISTHKWTVGYRDGKKVLVGPLSNVKGIGPSMVSAILGARARGEPLPARAQKLLNDPKTDIDTLTPITDAIKRIMPDPAARQIYTPPTPIGKLHESKEPYEVVVFCTPVKINPRDENEPIEVQKRGYEIKDGMTKYLRMMIADDTGMILAKINRFKFNRLAPPIINRGRAGKSLWAFKGKVFTAMGGLLVLGIDQVRYIGDMES